MFELEQLFWPHKKEQKTKYPWSSSIRFVKLRVKLNQIKETPDIQSTFDQIDDNVNCH